VALSRSLARTDARVVLVDFRGDGADAASMGEGKDLPGFADLFDGEASFAQVIFRDRKSRVHFIPAGRKPIGPGLVDEEHLETILSALTLTYDYVLLDTNDDMITTVAPGCGMALVVSEHGGGDPRTARAFDRVTAVTDAHILLLVVDATASRSEAARPHHGGRNRRKPTRPPSSWRWITRRISSARRGRSNHGPNSCCVSHSRRSSIARGVFRSCPTA